MLPSGSKIGPGEVKSRPNEPVGAGTKSPKGRAAFWSAYDAMQSLGGMAQFVANGWAGKDYTHINFAGGRRVAWALYDAINRGAEQHPPFTPVAHDNVIDTRKISHLEMMLRQAARPRMQKP